MHEGIDKYHAENSLTCIIFQPLVGFQWIETESQDTLIFIYACGFPRYNPAHSILLFPIKKINKILLYMYLADHRCSRDRETCGARAQAIYLNRLSSSLGSSGITTCITLEKCVPGFAGETNVSTFGYSR